MKKAILEEVRKLWEFRLYEPNGKDLSNDEDRKIRQAWKLEKMVYTFDDFYISKKELWVNDISKVNEIAKEAIKNHYDYFNKRLPPSVIKWYESLPIKKFNKDN